MWYLVCWHCGVRVPCEDTDEFVAAFADEHVPHLADDEWIEVFSDADLN